MIAPEVDDQLRPLHVVQRQTHPAIVELRLHGTISKARGLTERARQACVKGIHKSEPASVTGPILRSATKHAVGVLDPLWISAYDIGERRR